MLRYLCLLLALGYLPAYARAQAAPTGLEIATYTGLHAAAAQGNLGALRAEIATGASPNATDAHNRTPLHVAAHFGHTEIARALVQAGANPRALDARKYDIVTIAAVRDDEAFLKLALELGADAKAITSPYEGTALIAAAHLGHDGIVRELIRAGAPVDHVNNLGWTALIEAIVLGDGGKRHTACVQALLDAGADVNLGDREGRTPLSLARSRGFSNMEHLLSRAGGR